MTAPGPWPAVPDPYQPGQPSPSLRASDADRDVVAGVLAQAYAEGRLTVDEHADRLSAAMNAKTVGDLVPLTQDLAVARASAPASWTFGAPRPSDGNGFALSIFGGTSRKGQWFIPAQIMSLTLFGGTELDMRDATFTSPVIDIDLACLFGGLTVIVPEGVRVENQVISIFGGSDVKDASPVPGAPTVRLRGMCLFGGVSVKAKPRRTPPAQPELR